ncbi:hypothetical protein SAMN05216276_100240 [Streptosporangium subroseum]|uniref:Uncharacterized protein n=1 Tax=Streptosporangium subroseum TaxID=106412 RepID=A0A239AN17_9ACTN|nr:hypothetical protein [Streptosporangium subroseum]SNR96920.1 hypothetical protein SAMN05216276_100240 [Streptosporangium subroseum]
MKDVRVDGWNAFGTNRLGLDGPGFPLTINVSASHGVHIVNGTAARTCDLIDVLTPTTQSTAVVLNIDQYSWLDPDGDPLRPREIARQQGIQATAQDITWAQAHGSAPSDLLTMDWSDLNRFFDGSWSHYGADVLDVEGPLSDDVADEVALASRLWSQGSCLLREFPRSRVFYSGHDDCYLHVESVDPTMPTRIFTRLIALFGGSALLDDDTESVMVAEPQFSIAENMLRESTYWVGTILDRDPWRRMTMGFTPTRWRLGSPLSEDISLQLAFDLKSRTWDAR